MEVWSGEIIDPTRHTGVDVCYVARLPFAARIVERTELGAVLSAVCRQRHSNLHPR
jgi:hypothetical protein